MNTPIKDKNSRGSDTSASNAYYDSLCQGRHLAQLGIADIASEDATFGQGIHDALAADVPTLLNAEQLSIYESCIEIRERLIKEAFGPDADKVKRFTERRCQVQVLAADGKGRHRHSGQVDFLARHGTKGLIIEYKTLPAELPDSANNLQLRDQVVLAAGELILKEVAVAIIQPLVTHQPELCLYSEATIKRAEAEMFQRVRNSNNPTAPRTAGEAQCKFCKARHACPERARLLEVATPAAVSSLASVPVVEWTPTQRALFCERLPMAMKWLNECKDQIKALLEGDPTSIPGWALEAGSIKRPVIKPEELHARFIALGGSTEQFLSCVDIGKGDFEKAVRAVTQLKGKALAVKIKELLDGLTAEKADAPSLARRELLP